MKKILGVDLGGTNVRVGRVENGSVVDTFSMPISSHASEKDVLDEIIHAISQVLTDEVSGIGVGVPSLVDEERGIVYEVQNIPSWQEIYLKNHLEEQFHVPVQINNDVNCFVLGERFFGKGKGCGHLLGIAIGTGIGAGLFLNGKLYSGKNCGAGEIGMMPYLDANYERYCSGQFFKNLYHLDGQQIYQAALEGDRSAISCFEIFGSHVGNIMLAVLYAFDPEMIILGGSISKAYALFEKTMWDRINTFAYKSAIKHLRLEVSDLPEVSILGAAALCSEF